MEKGSILEQLKQSLGISDVEEIDYKPNFLVTRFFYDFDDDETEAARDYADSQGSMEDDEDAWYDERYIPYLTDIAVDEVRDTIEDIVESGDVSAEYISYEPERDDNSLEFIAVFADKDVEFDIDEVLDSIGI